MRQAVLYRLYPSTSQQRQLASILETPRRWYNTCLEARKSAYADEGRTVSKVEQLRTVKTSKATNPYAAPLHSHLLQGVVSDLDKAFHAFFRRIKAGEEPGYPRFKGRNRWRSVGFKEYGNGCKVDGRRVKVHGVGRLAVRWHRPIPGTVKTLRLLCKAGKWYAALSCVVDSAPLPSTGAEVGIDVGLASLLTTTDGDHIPHPAWYRHSQRALRVAGRRVSRRKKGGTNRRKAIHALQRVHERIANQRKDCLYSVIVRSPPTSGSPWKTSGLLTWSGTRISPKVSWMLAGACWHHTSCVGATGRSPLLAVWLCWSTLGAPPKPVRSVGRWCCISRSPSGCFVARVGSPSIEMRTPHGIFSGSDRAVGR